MPTTLGEDLKKAIGFVDKSVSGKSTLQILTHIRMQYDPAKGITFQATNLEIFAAVTLQCQQMIGDTGFDVTVPAKVLKESIGAIDKTTQVRLEAANDTLQLQAGSLKLNLKGFSGADFPIMPDIAEAQTLVLPLETLVKLFDTVAYAASTDESRPTLTGVEVAMKGDEHSISIAGTDGYRLAYYCLTNDAITEDATLIVPARSVQEFVRVAGNALGASKHGASEDGTLAIMRNRNQIAFQIPVVETNLRDGIIASQLIDARFPDYRTIIPKTRATTAIVDAGELEKALKTAKLFAKDNGGITRLDIVGEGISECGTLTIRATSAEMGEVEQELKATVVGGAISMAFNIKYLQETVSHIEHDEIVIELTQSTCPGLFRAPTVVDGTNIHVIMPMHPPR